MRASLFACVSGLLIAGAASAATLRGSLRYAGQPSSQTLPDLVHGKVALQASGQEWVVADVDTASSSWVVTDLAAGTYRVQVAVATAPVGFPRPTAGVALASAVGVALSDGEDKRVDLDLAYQVHVTLPFDNLGQWPGSASTCPYGAAVPRSFTFAWQGVPQAVRYRAIVNRWSCGGWLAATVTETTGTAVTVTQQTVAGEEYLILDVRAYDAEGRCISDMPYVNYGNTSSTGHYVRLEAGTGRPIHQSASIFLPQVAHVAGAQGSFWTSDLTLANRTSTAVTATLFFTPRGANGTTDYREAKVEVPGNSCRAFQDVVSTLFSTTGAGSLEISGVGLSAVSRCATPAPGGGSYGQGFLPAESTSIASRTGPVCRLGAGGVVKGAFRSNLAIVEVWGEPVSVMVRLFDRDGAEIGHRQVDLQPLSNVQLNDVVGNLGGPSTFAEGYVTVEPSSGEGRVSGVLSVVDNTSNDPATIPLVPW